MQPACAQVSAKSILTGELKPKRVNSSHQYAWPRSYQGKMLTLGWMMESRASISTTWTNQTDLDSPVHQNSSLCPDQYTDQSTGRASMLICVLTWCISCPKSVHKQSTGRVSVRPEPWPLDLMESAGLLINFFACLIHFKSFIY